MRPLSLMTPADGNIKASNGNDSESSTDSYKKVPKMSEETECEEKEKEADTSVNVSVSRDLPLVSLCPGLQKKATPFSLKSWASLALKLDGRDKITKIFQYLSRLLSWWLAGTESGSRFKVLYQSLSNSRKAFRLGRSFIEIQKLHDSGLGQLLRSSLLGIGKYDSNKPAWQVLGSSLKMIGLLGYWAGDNVAYVTGSGFLDDYLVEGKERLARRKALKDSSARFAARFYFAGSISGLLTNIRTFWEYRQKNIREAHERLTAAAANGQENDVLEAAQAAYKKVREKQFSLFLAVLKSVCDVIVFSNMGGVNLVEKFRGKKANEGFICLCGLTSASTVIYNNFPDEAK